MFIKTAAFDLGGKTFRCALPQVNAEARTVQVGKTCQETVACKNLPELISLSLKTIKTIGNFDGIDTSVFSIAGPVDINTGVVEKFTNQPIKETNLPLGSELSNRLFQETGRHINVLVVNDGDACTTAEFSPEGALGNLGLGELGIAFIIGNGIGGGLYRVGESGLIAVEGAHEPGHWPVSLSMVEALGIPPQVYDFVECGCEMIGSRVERTNVCGELLAKGPSLQQIFQKRLGLHCIDNKEVVSHLLDNFSSFNDARRKKLIAESILKAEAQLLVQRLEMLQRGYRAPINVALVGGVGKNFGPWLLPLMDELTDNNVKYQRAKWGVRPNYLVGAFPSNETNLFGDALIAADFTKTGKQKVYSEQEILDSEKVPAAV